MIGSASELYRGIRETRDLTGLYGLHRKFYSWGRGVDDELKTVASGGMTGLLYRL